MIRPEPQKGRKGCWRVDFRVPGTAKRIRRKFKDQAAAAAFIDDFFSGLKEQPQIGDLIRQYLRWSETIKGKTPATVKRDAVRLAVFLRWLTSVRLSAPNDVTFKHFDRFRTWFFDNAPFDSPRVRKRFRPPNTAANWEHYRQNIAAFYAWCQKRGFASVNPAADPEFKHRSDRRIPPHFRPPELRKIFDYFDTRDADQPVPWFSIMFRTLAYTGMRFGELHALEWSAVDFKRRRITIVKSKSKKPRVIPIAEPLLPWLKKLPHDTPPFSLYSASWCLRQLHEACDAVRIDRRRIHDLRHTFAASLARNGVSLAQIQKLLGHSDISSTLVYIHFMPDDLSAALTSLDY